MKRFILFLLIAALASASSVNAATIYGTVYDLSLKKAPNAEVEINSSPRQFMVAINGTYSFEVPNGAYVIGAKQFQKSSLIALVKENVTVKQEGSYVIDLILFPEIESGFEEPDSFGINESFLDISIQKKYSVIPPIILIIIILSFVFYYYFIKKKKVKEIKSGEEHSDDDELRKLTNIIKREGGRTTQKDIRKQIPLSEAKISLMITELEHKGIIEKIKKGRGNIIILKKK